MSMNIKPVSYNILYPSFKAATVNINALSDTHGELLLASNALEKMNSCKHDIFGNENKGNTNIVAICGDWFMNGGKKGYNSDPNKEAGKFQLDIFNGFISKIKEMAPIKASIFTAGNHEFDGGVDLLDEIFSSIDSDVLISNLDISKSSGFRKSIEEGKIVNEKIVECEDDKNPNLKHKILFLGISPVNMYTYQPNMKGVRFIDNVKKMQRDVKREDYEKTLEMCKQRIADFKEKNTNGIVVVLSHTGVEFADNLAKEAPVNVIFDGHEHKDTIRTVNNVPIASLSQNFKKIVNAKFIIGDNGDIESTSIKSIYPSKNKSKGALVDLYNRIFSQDIKKQFFIRTKDSNISSLDVAGVRLGNNFLANFVTDAVLSELKKQDDSVDIFALNASSIRHSLCVSNEKASVSNLDIMNVLAGIKEDEGEILINEVSGSQLAYLVFDNILFSKDDPQKNPLIQYSGLIIDRTNIIKSIQNGKNHEDIFDFIIDAKTQQPISADKIYKIANVEKYFKKSKNPYIKELKKTAKRTGFTVQDLFENYFNNNRENIYAPSDIRVK